MPPVATTTSLGTSPTSPVAEGTTVTLTATVMPATVIGTVQFKDVTTCLGPAIPVRNGTVSGTTSRLSRGLHQLTAMFTPENPGDFTASTAPEVFFTVTGP